MLEIGGAAYTQEIIKQIDSSIKVGINQSDQLFASEWVQNVREKHDFRMVGACKVSAGFLEAFICCLFERTASAISSIKRCFCHSVRKTVYLRKTLFQISKESEIMIQCKMAFTVKEKCTRT